MRILGLCYDSKRLPTATTNRNEFPMMGRRVCPKDRLINASLREVLRISNFQERTEEYRNKLTQNLKRMKKKTDYQMQFLITLTKEEET